METMLNELFLISGQINQNYISKQDILSDSALNQNFAVPTILVVNTENNLIWILSSLNSLIVIKQSMIDSTAQPIIEEMSFGKLIVPNIILVQNTKYNVVIIVPFFDGELKELLIGVNDFKITIERECKICLGKKTFLQSCALKLITDNEEEKEILLFAADSNKNIYQVKLTSSFNEKPKLNISTILILNSNKFFKHKFGQMLGYSTGIPLCISVYNGFLFMITSHNYFEVFHLIDTKILVSIKINDELKLNQDKPKIKFDFLESSPLIPNTHNLTYFQVTLMISGSVSILNLYTFSVDHSLGFNSSKALSLVMCTSLNNKIIGNVTDYCQNSNKLLVVSKGNKRSYFNMFDYQNYLTCIPIWQFEDKADSIIADCEQILEANTLEQQEYVLEYINRKLNELNYFAPNFLNENDISSVELNEDYFSWKEEIKKYKTSFIEPSQEKKNFLLQIIGCWFDQTTDSVPFVLRRNILSNEVFIFSALSECQKIEYLSMKFNKIFQQKLENEYYETHFKAKEVNNFLHSILKENPYNILNYRLYYSEKTFALNIINKIALEYSFISNGDVIDKMDITEIESFFQTYLNELDIIFNNLKIDFFSVLKQEEEKSLFMRANLAEQVMLFRLHCINTCIINLYCIYSTLVIHKPTIRIDYSKIISLIFKLPELISLEFILKQTTIDQEINDYMETPIYKNKKNYANLCIQYFGQKIKEASQKINKYIMKINSIVNSYYLPYFLLIQQPKDNIACFLNIIQILLSQNDYDSILKWVEYFQEMDPAIEIVRANCYFKLLNQNINDQIAFYFEKSLLYGTAFSNEINYRVQHEKEEIKKLIVQPNEFPNEFANESAISLHISLILLNKTYEKNLVFSCMNLLVEKQNLELAYNLIFLLPDQQQEIAIENFLHILRCQKGTTVWSKVQNFTFHPKSIVFNMLCYQLLDKVYLSILDHDLDSYKIFKSKLTKLYLESKNYYKFGVELIALAIYLNRYIDQKNEVKYKYITEDLNLALQLLDISGQKSRGFDLLDSIMLKHHPDIDPKSSNIFFEKDIYKSLVSCKVGFHTSGSEYIIEELFEKKKEILALEYCKYNESSLIRFYQILLTRKMKFENLMEDLTKPKMCNDFNDDAAKELLYQELIKIDNLMNDSYIQFDTEENKNKLLLFEILFQNKLKIPEPLLTSLLLKLPEALLKILQKYCQPDEYHKLKQIFKDEYKQAKNANANTSTSYNEFRKTFEEIMDSIADLIVKN